MITIVAFVTVLVFSIHHSVKTIIINIDGVEYNPYHSFDICKEAK